MRQARIFMFDYSLNYDYKSNSSAKLYELLAAQPHYDISVLAKRITATKQAPLNTLSLQKFSENANF